MPTLFKYYLLIIVSVFSSLLIQTGCNKTTEPLSIDTTFRLVFLKPNGGEIYHVGDSVPISIEFKNSKDSFYFVDFRFSRDNGQNFPMTISVINALNGGNTIRWTGKPRKDTVWVIPPPDPTDTSRTHITNQAKIKVEHYTNKNIADVNDNSFTILP